MLSDFKVRPYRSSRLSDYSKRMSTPRHEEDTIVDQIMVAVLKQQGYSWAPNTSSKYDPQALYDSLARYSPRFSHMVDTTTPAWLRAIRATYKIFAKPKHLEKLEPLSNPDAVWQALKPEKSSGLPMMAKKADDFWYAYHRAEQVVQRRKVPSPCIAYKRTQLGGKTRLVWGYPLEMTILESRFARPLIQMFMERTTPMAFGISKFELGGRVAAIDDAYGQTYGLDFSKFDSTVPRELIRIAFSILETWFRDEDKDRYGWSEIVNYFVYTPIVMPNQKLYTGKEHGVPSGSYFTQLVDSVVNVMLQFWLAEECGYTLNAEKLLVLGDDVLISIPKEIELHSIKEKLHSIGMIMHPEKTHRYAHFLGATWKKGIPYRDTHELLQKMVYPENYRKYPSLNRVDRLWLAYQLICQYAAAYANAVEMLEGFFQTGNMDVVDQAPLGVKAYTKVEWDDDHMVSALEFVSGSKTTRVLLSARLFA